MCLPSHSNRFCPISTSISASVQFGPRTFCGREACVCEGPVKERVAVDFPLPRPRAVERTLGIGESGSTNPPEISPSTSAGSWVDGKCESPPRSTILSIVGRKYCTPHKHPRMSEFRVLPKKNEIKQNKPRGWLTEIPQTASKHAACAGWRRMRTIGSGNPQPGRED